MRYARTYILGAISFGMIVGSLAAQQDSESKKSFADKSAKRRAMSEGYPTGPMWDLLDQFAGVWTVTEHHYDALGQVIATVEGTEEVVWILDGHAIERSYTTKTDDKTYKAIGTFVWNDATQTFEGVWFDNRAGGGATISKGSWNEDRRMIHYKLETEGGSGKSTRYEVLDRITSKDTHVATTYVVSGAKRLKRLVVNYKRNEPCGIGGVMSLLSITPTDEKNESKK